MIRYVCVVISKAMQQCSDSEAQSWAGRDDIFIGTLWTLCSSSSPLPVDAVELHRGNLFTAGLDSPEPRSRCLKVPRIAVSPPRHRLQQFRAGSCWTRPQEATAMSSCSCELREVALPQSLEATLEVTLIWRCQMNPRYPSHVFDVLSQHSFAPHLAVAPWWLWPMHAYASFGSMASMEPTTVLSIQQFRMYVSFTNWHRKEPSLFRTIMPSCFRHAFVQIMPEPFQFWKSRSQQESKNMEHSKDKRSKPRKQEQAALTCIFCRVMVAASSSRMCHDKIMDEKRVGDGHQSIHRGLYICPLEGFPLLDGGPYLIWLFFTMACYFWNCLLFHVYLEDMYVCPGNFAARLWKGERNPLTTNFWDAAFISTYQNQSKHKIHKIIHYT